MGLVTIPIPEKSVSYIKEQTGYPVFSGKVKESLLQEYGIPAGATTFSYATSWIAREDLPDDIAYWIVKALFDNWDEFAPIHVRAAETTLENAVKNPAMPYHEGVIRYYKEMGVWTTEQENLQKEMLAKPRG